MNFAALEKSLRYILNDVEDGVMTAYVAIPSVMSIIAVETWTHTSSESLTFADLTDEELRMINYWLILNRRDYANQSVIQFVRDMREVFPGLGLKVTSDLIRGA